MARDRFPLVRVVRKSGVVTEITIGPSAGRTVAVTAIIIALIAARGTTPSALAQRLLELVARLM